MLPMLRVYSQRPLRIARCSGRAVRLSSPASSPATSLLRRGTRLREPQTRRWATSTSPHSTVSDPAEDQAIQCFLQGTQKLEEGDFQGAKELYERSIEIKRSANSLFNLGVAHLRLKEYDDAIDSWKESLVLRSWSAPAHSNLASAYMVSPLSRPALALHHLHIALSLTPEDPEITCTIGQVLEDVGQLEEALKYYNLSKENGVDRARNVSAKILGKKMQDMVPEAKSKDLDS